MNAATDLSSKVLPRDDLLAAGTWKPASIGPQDPNGPWRRTALICDPAGHIISLSRHRIDAEGRVTPSVVCPHGCGFHETLTLLGWDPRPLPPGVLEGSALVDVTLTGWTEQPRAADFVRMDMGHLDPGRQPAGDPLGLEATLLEIAKRRASIGDRIAAALIRADGEMRIAHKVLDHAGIPREMTLGERVAALASREKQQHASLEERT